MILMKPFSYTSKKTPVGYTCSKCNASQRKLWRLYNAFFDEQELFCADCAEKDQDESPSNYTNGEADQIGSLIPAVPTEDGETFWGYTSVPENGVLWWHSLKTRDPFICTKENPWTEEKGSIVDHIDAFAIASFSFEETYLCPHCNTKFIEQWRAQC